MLTQYVFSVDPTPLVCVFSSLDNNLTLYSLSGQFLNEKKIMGGVKKMLVCRDSSFQPLLIALMLNSNIHFLALPTLEDSRKKVVLPGGFEAQDILLSMDESTLYIVGARDLIICQP